jgi:hypothetical protein
MRLVIAAWLAAALLAPALAGAKDADAPAAAQLDCAYAARGVGDVAPYKNCAHVDAAGDIRLAARHLRRLRFDRYGLASLWLGQSFYYVSRSGRLAPVMAMDNWADDFADGLARSPRGAKVGYIDRSLALAIPARFDGALPFKHGRAAVCVGCRLDRAREPADYVGGGWGCIDTGGREVTPPDRPTVAAAGC